MSARRALSATECTPRRPLMANAPPAGVLAFLEPRAERMRYAYKVAASTMAIVSAPSTRGANEDWKGARVDEGARFEPQDPEYRERIRASFGRQAIMCLIGASLHRVAPGEVEIALPYREDLTQQDGFLHAGVVTTIMDSACGYAAYTLMPAEARVLSVEFKVNLLAPATGAQMLARARVIRPGRTITVCYGEVFALGANAVVREGAEPAGKLVATMMATLIAIMPRG